MYEMVRGKPGVNERKCLKIWVNQCDLRKHEVKQIVVEESVYDGYIHSSLNVKYSVR